MSDFSFSPELMTSIEAFVKTLKDHPKMLESKELGFFREYLKSLGCRLPESTSTTNEAPKFTAGSPPAPEAFEQEDEVEEPDEPYPTLDEEGIIPKDDLDTNIEMGDPDQVVSDEDLEQSNGLKIEAVGLFGEGNYEESVRKYSDAIKLNSGSALLYAKRAQCFIQLEKPNAAIRDCNRALQINPDSAIAYKFRGRAHRLLGHWEEAARDLRQHQLIDFDETAEEWLKEVTPNAKKIEEWRLRKKRHDDEKELRHRKKLLAERQRAHEEAKAAPAHDFEMPDFDMPMPGSGGGGGGGGTGIPGLDNLMKDPEVIELFQDPEVSAAFADISGNPMNILKHQSNPKVAKLLKILQTKMGGGGGMGGMGGMPGMGGFPGGMGGMGGFPGGMPNFGGGGGEPTNPKPPGDVDLD